MKRSFDVLAARGFLVALAVLLLNDFVLKPAFGNAFTGKLSDFAGLFAFSVFWMAVFPRRRRVVCAATAAAFVAWKSAAAQPLIDLWNAWMPLTVGRTVDATDLVALVSVAAAYRYAETAPRQRTVSPARWALVPVSLFAFAATSYISQYSYQNRYVFPVAEPVLAASVDSLRMGPYQREPAWGDTVELYIPVENCFGTMSARLVVRGGAEATDVELTQLANGCRTSRSELLRVFERCFVARLDSAVASRASRPAQPRHLTPVGRGMKRVGCTPPA